MLFERLGSTVAPNIKASRKAWVTKMILTEDRKSLIATSIILPKTYEINAQESTNI